MKYLIITLSCLAFAAAQCPPSGCPPPTRPPNCGPPDCSRLENRYHENALFPHRDPTMYWQCAPINATHWGALERFCACSTVFNYNLSPPRCSFWWEEGWFADPQCGWSNPPIVRECVPDCPSCNENPGNPIPTPTPTPTTTTQNGNCPCPCPPCIWWPCTPCNPVNTCPCNQQRG